MRYKVKYKLPGDNRYLEVIVDADSQSQAKHIAQAQIPSAIIIGGPQPIS
jgi:hypothetical protein